MPAFGRWPKEAAHIGNMLAGYGELEFDLARCLGAVLGDDSVGFRTLFRVQGESARIEVADAILKPTFHAVKLGDQYNETLGAIRWCKGVRNQYAHCHWIDFTPEGLFFTDLDKPVKKATGPLMLQFLQVDAPLLAIQEEYFHYTDQWLTYLFWEYRLRKGEVRSHTWTTPKVIPQPNENNPPDTHPCPLARTGGEPHTQGVLLADQKP